MNITPATSTVGRRIYDFVHVTLWALLAVWVVIMIIHIPQMSDARATAERHRVLEISAENGFYCEKWGMTPGTHEHTLCTLDLQDIRAKIEQRIADDTAF
jgi:hypothetical protein